MVLALMFTHMFQSNLDAIHEDHEIRTYVEAVQYPNWHQAIAEELEAFSRTQTFGRLYLILLMVSLSNFVESIRSKHQADGYTKRQKAHLVAGGFTQDSGICH